MAREIGGRSQWRVAISRELWGADGELQIFDEALRSRRGFPQRNEVYGEVEMLALEIDAIIGRHDANVGAGG